MTSDFPGSQANISMIAVNDSKNHFIWTSGTSQRFLNTQFENWAIEELIKLVMEIKIEEGLIVLCNASLEEWCEIVFYCPFFSIVLTHIFCIFMCILYTYIFLSLFFIQTHIYMFLYIFSCFWMTQRKGVLILPLG